MLQRFINFDFGVYMASVKGLEKQITILKELKEYIIPLTKEEFELLESNILQHGCRDPLVVWPRENSFFLVDGHNRFKICQKHNIDFKIKKIDFETIDTAKVWMIDNQMGRRNLTPDQLSYYRGVKYNSLKNKKGGYENVRSKGQSELSTSERIAEKFNVSESTIKRDAKFAEGLNIISRGNPKLKTEILSGTVKAKRSDIQILPDAPYADKILIKSEADLAVKAKKIRADILDEYEKKASRLSQTKTTKAQEEDAEPVFLDKDDRVRKLKAKIISAINRAIRDKDETAIKELRKLIDKLSAEIH
ncbi:ParB N-terminal domain-containing protein [Ohtaekwangia koreensis]|uniref:ParB-like nuclease domain-containing protein n=1 Tax=Ohtaekwangia koreensis TaxID=688867 RepID=A0A1T5M5Q4_9BACT|nr:ParB N-terminal domain-containing protein [Ohtaekwangia koreensis]SKC83374.1 ParB-like nuclease domain-containing protein [Ohtaekwangia koreensis]